MWPLLYFARGPQRTPGRSSQVAVCRAWEHSVDCCAAGVGVQLDGMGNANGVAWCRLP